MDDISNNTLEKALSRSEADALIALKSMHTNDETINYVNSRQR